MKKSVEEGYEMLLEAKKGGSLICAVAYVIFEDYSAGVSGYEQREEIRAWRPSVYELLQEVKTLEDFRGLIARYRLEENS